MPTITSTGVGSGLDINSLVSQLVAAERAAPEQRMVREDAKLTTEFTALASLKGAMSSFRTAVAALRLSTSLDLRKATVGDDTAFTASATGQAAAGSYDVEVVQLATAARIGSALYPTGPDSVVGTGTLNISVGGSSFSIEIGESNDQLGQIRDAINASEDNPGVRATLIRDSGGTGSYLVLTGTATGAANAISVSATNADAGLAQLVSDLNAADVDRDVVAQDAIVFVSGYEIHSTTNTVSGAVDGVTLNLLKAEEGTLVSLNIERDDAAIQKKVEGFVSAFNALAQQITNLSRYDAATQSAGPLLGDAMLRGVDSQVRRIMGEAVSGLAGNYTTLASLGISTTATGTLQLDSAKLQTALQADAAAVANVFGSDNGVAKRLDTFLGERLSVGGELAARDDRIANRRKELEVRREALEARMEVIQARYLRQFTALDTMLSQLQSTSSFLSQQLSGLQNLNGSNR